MKKRHIALIALVIILSSLNTLYYDTYTKTINLNRGLKENNRTVEPQQLFNDVSDIIEHKYIEPTLNHQDWTKWKKRYEGKILTNEDAKVAINTMILSLNEPYTQFLPEYEFKQLKSSIKSKIYGIGITISQENNIVQVIGVTYDSPAEKAGIQKGDILNKVDGHFCKGKAIDDIAILIRGDKDTNVELEIIRDGEKLTKSITRDEIKIQTVEYNIIENIGYIQITSFISTRMNEELKIALEKTRECDGLILDLRNNTGGLLENAVYAAEKFIKEGPIVSVVTRGGQKNTINASVNEIKYNKPIVILINRGSASASEIFAGAMKDYNRAILVGQKSYGKGMVQNVIPLPNKSGLNITIAKYLTPLDNDINKIGITPHIEVIPQKGDLSDVQFDVAKNKLNEIIKQKKNTPTY